MDYNGVGAWEARGTYPAKINQSSLPPPPGPQVSSRVDTNISRVSAAEYLSKNNL